jgi:hypothetical protein
VSSDWSTWASLSGPGGIQTPRISGASGPARRAGSVALRPARGRRQPCWTGTGVPSSIEA